MQPRGLESDAAHDNRQEKADFRGILPAARLSIVFARNQRSQLRPA
jgi:hypothetical protein